MSCKFFIYQDNECIGIVAGIGALILLLSVAVVVLARCVCKLKRQAVAADQEQNDVNMDFHGNDPGKITTKIQENVETSLNNLPTEENPGKENDAKPAKSNCGNQNSKSVRKSQSRVARKSIASSPNSDQNELQTKNEDKEDKMKQAEETDNENPYAEVEEKCPSVSPAPSDSQFLRQGSEHQQKLLDNAKHYTFAAENEKQTEIEKQSAIPLATNISEDYDRLFTSPPREKVEAYETVMLAIDPPTNNSPNEDFDFPPPLPPPFVDDDDSDGHDVEFLLPIPGPPPDNFDDELKSSQDENVYDLPDDL